MKNREKKRERERERENEEMKSQRNQSRKLFHQADSRLLALPSFITIKILARTPLRGILNCRCVCKNLRELMSDPNFVNVFISRTPFLSILYRRGGVNYNVVRLLGDNHNNPSSHLVDARFIPKSNSFALQIIGCCNGLICLWNKYAINSKFYITNPVLGECALHPNPKNDQYAALEEVYGFCSYPNPGEYKIIKIKTRRAYRGQNQEGYYRKSEAWILDVGTDRWRYVGDVPFPLFEGFCLAFLNGCYHWMASVDRSGVRVITLHSLDITKEQAHPFPAPSELTLKTMRQDLGVLGRTLCIYDTSRANHLIIWTMRQYGVATSWAKRFILKHSITDPRPIAFNRNRMTFMSNHWGEIVCYDPREGKFTNVYDCHAYGTDLRLFSPTFLSLKHVFSEAFLTVTKVNSYN